ncbi:hypothetical protein FNF27_00903 [Cafeteria roenbergensis]|uniref:DM10 domain-containing protein n=2 Tax=Cafeteria roenbergensis TaxID=33653 RepID=A0A5A8DSN9_CAFRO|nr:hypothetical protein FNF31_00344 [Cafeteria roenbergensis]KAA0177731.1 hypothetical protein FNF27_00903 [Cafeteria roenbergensis]
MAAEATSGGQYSFGCELLDPITNTLRPYNIAMWPFDASVEVYDPTSRRTILKRCRPRESISVDDFFLGNTITVMSRPYVVRKYLSAETEARFATKRATSLCVIKPCSTGHAGTLVDELLTSGFDIGAVRMVRLSKAEAEEFYRERRHRPSFVQEVEFLAADAVIAVVVSAEDAVSKLQGWAGPANPADAAEALPGSIRARFGTDAVRNAVHVSATPAAAASEEAFMFARERSIPAVFRHCSALVIRPHAVKAKAAGQIIQAVLDSGMEISGLRSVALEGRDIEDYLEPYKGVLPEHSRWMTELSSGTSIIAEVRGEDVVPRLRELCGPYCPEIAGHLRPDSLRARFGINRVQNAVLCTDLPSDGPLECKYLFCVVDA